MIVAAVAAVVLVAVFAFGGAVNNMFTSSSTCLQNASTGAGFAACPNP